MKHVVAVTLIVLACAGVLMGDSEDEIERESELWRLAIGGNWSDDTQRGYYVIATWRECSPAHCTTVAYLRRVIAHGVAGQFRSVSVTPISEVNGGVGSFVRTVEFLRDDPQPHFKLDVVNTYDSSRRVLRLWTNSAGSYRAAFE